MANTYISDVIKKMGNMPKITGNLSYLTLSSLISISLSFVNQRTKIDNNPEPMILK